MDKTYRCSRCQKEFKGKNSLKDYKQHLMDRAGDPGLCVAPGTKQHPDIVLDVKKSPPPPPTVEPTTPSVPEKPVVARPTAPLKQDKGDNKLELVYKWVGVHDTCGTEIKTLVLKTVDEGKWVTVAYCQNCDKQLRERPVPKL